MRYIIHIKLFSPDDEAIKERKWKFGIDTEKMISTRSVGYWLSILLELGCSTVYREVADTYPVDESEFSLVGPDWQRN